jgi:hypothetical protein
MRRTVFGVLFAAAAFGAVAVPQFAPEAQAAARSRSVARGTLVGAGWVTGTGIKFRISGENLANATWRRTQTTDRAGNIVTETGTASVGRRSYRYTANLTWSRGSRSPSGRVTVAGGILSPSRQSARF